MPTASPISRGRICPRDDGGRALIGDTRNDENVIIAQLHLLFIRFHNRVVDQIAAPGMPVIRVFHEARRLVRWHYQWLIVNDFLPKLVGEEAVAAARAAGVAVTTVAPEFAAAAYRFGHSMVREDYKLNDRPAVPLFRPRGETPDRARTLAGNRRLPAELVIEWDRFFRIGARSPQRSMRIDTSLTTEFDAMPGMPKTSLALLDLLQGIEDGVPTGTALHGGDARRAAGGRAAGPASGTSTPACAGSCSSARRCGTSCSARPRPAAAAGRDWDRSARGSWPTS